MPAKARATSPASSSYPRRPRLTAMFTTSASPSWSSSCTNGVSGWRISAVASGIDAGQVTPWLSNSYVGTSGLVYVAGTGSCARVPRPLSMAAAAVNSLKMPPAPSGANVVTSRCTVSPLDVSSPYGRFAASASTLRVPAPGSTTAITFAIREAAASSGLTVDLTASTAFFITSGSSVVVIV